MRLCCCLRRICEVCCLRAKQRGRGQESRVKSAWETYPNIPGIDAPSPYVTDLRSRWRARTSRGAGKSFGIVKVAANAPPQGQCPEIMLHTALDATGRPYTSWIVPKNRSKSMDVLSLNRMTLITSATFRHTLHRLRSLDTDTYRPCL